jgi:hypothetical protein
MALATSAAFPRPTAAIRVLSGAVALMIILARSRAERKGNPTGFQREPAMRRDKHLRVVIGPDGVCTVDAINFTGTSCHAATAEVTAALGGQIDHQRDKPEARVRERGEQREGAR